MILRIIFVRHGESISNKVQKYVPCIHSMIMDPKLSQKGIENTKEMKEKLPKTDIVCCSELLRAKQTAYISYPDRYIYEIPHVNELGYGFDNMPQDEITQLDKFPVMSFIKQPKNHNLGFIDYIKEFAKKKIGDKENITITVFTHHRFIKKITGMKTKNNEYIEKIYKL